MTDDRIEVTEIIAHDRETDTGYRRWTTADGIVIRDEAISPSPWRFLKLDPTGFCDTSDEIVPLPPEEYP